VNPHDQLSLFGSIRDANHMLDAAQSTYAEAYNFRLLGTRGLAKTWKERAVDNIEAIHLAQTIERDGRSATEAEQRQLIKFTGFGASDLANQLFPGPGRQTATEWKGVANKLHQSITDGERAALARATQYAHYTPEYMVRAIWKVAKRMGFTGGQVLEPGCFTPSTLIQTKRGWVPISEVGLGDEVMGADSRWHDVIRLIPKRPNGKLVTMEVAAFPRTVEMTRDHELFSVPVHICKGQKRPCHIQDDRKCRHLRSSGSKDGKHRCGEPWRSYEPSWNEAGTLNVGDYLVEAFDNKVEDRAKLSLTSIRSGNLKGPLEIHCDAALMRAIGIYLAEGSTDKNSVVFSFRNDESDMLAALEAAFNRYGWEVRHNHRPGEVCVDYRVHSRTLVAFFRQFGSSASTKCIPTWCAHLPLEKQAALLWGIWRGDGMTQSYGFQPVVTVSIDLALGVRNILYRFGIVPSVRETPAQVGVERPDGKGVSDRLPKYTVEVSGAHLSKASQLYNVEHPALKKREFFLNRTGVVQGDKVFHKINSIGSLEWDGPVHDLTVEDAHSYGIGIATAHNCGTGLFLALMPEGMASKSSYFGVENCPTTARIARLLYPEETILESDFTQAQLPPDFDLTIGNPPFSNRVVQGAKGRPELSLHDFFIARSIERLRAGGLAAFVVSRYTMDKQDKSARQYISSMADLLGAIRMPQGSMRADAGTDVVVDLLFFRKRHEGQPCAGVEWLNASFEAVTGDVKGGKINEYFAAHPDMALGKHAIVTSQFGPIYSLKASADRPLDIGLAEAIASLPENVYQTPALPQADIEVDATPRVIVGTAKQGATIKEGSYFVENNELYQVIDGGSVPVEVKSGRGTSGIFEKHAQIIRDLCAVRDAVRAVLSAQMSDVPSFIEQAQLARAYDAFVTAHGPINTTTITERAKNEEDKAAFGVLKEWRLRRTKVELAKIKNKEPHPSHVSAIFDLESQFEREFSSYGPITQAKIETVETNRYPNLAPFADDPDCWLVATIENYDPTTNTAVRGPIFSQQVVRPPIALEASTAADALAVVLNERGRVDMARIAELRNLTESEAVRELGDLVYFNPTSQEWETADQYLSGLVRDKLTFAQSAAESDPSFRRNVEALEKVQPRDLEPAEITARLGAPWIGANDIQRFVREVMRIDTSIYHTPRIATWSVQMRDFAGLASATTDWGTPRMHAGELLLHALSSKTPQVFDEVEDGFGGVKRVLNPSETQAAKDKLAVIQQAFENWIWTDKERSERLAAIYNKNFNNLVTRKFNGDHLVLPGASPVIQLRPHQKRVVWRMICNGNTYLAHAVGAGKTFAGAAGIMEQKRLGLLRKPLICVPNHMLAQWSREFLQLYPQANILVADEENFEKSKRSRFIARATTGDWDAIIITHSAFKFIPTPHEFEEEMIQGLLDQVEEVAETISRDDRVSTRRITQMRKHIEAKKEALEARLKAHDGRTDNMVHIGEMGVDSIFIDEGQQFRKLTFMTNMSDLKGVDPNGSDRAWHLYMATKFLHKKVYVEQGKKSRAIFMASGTPYHEHHRRVVQPSAIHVRGDARGSQYPALRCMGRDFRHHAHRAGITALRQLQGRDALRRVRQHPRTDSDVLGRCGCGHARGLGTIRQAPKGAKR
jgi:N12 class adenine-specific DNA methylase/intein/homing endonuclease